MKNSKYVALTVMLIMSTGCGLTIANDKPVASFVPYIGFTPTKVVGIEVIRVGTGDDYIEDDKSLYQNGLIAELKQKRVAILKYPYVGQQVDYIISGTVSGKFRDTGAENFFTWWPGPFLFAHGWHGTTFIYDTSASATLKNTASGEVRTYATTMTATLKHTSGNIFHIAGAALVFPGVIKGAINVSPRLKYREQIYAAVYSDLWRDISSQIASDIHADEYKQIQSNQRVPEDRR